MKPCFRAYAKEMVPSLILMALSVLLFRPYAAHPAMLVSLIFAAALFFGLGLALRATRHLVVNPRT